MSTKSESDGSTNANIISMAILPDATNQAMQHFTYIEGNKYVNGAKGIATGLMGEDESVQCDCVFNRTATVNS